MEDLIHETPRLDLSVPSVFKLYKMETGQRVFVFTEVKERAEFKAVGPVVDLSQKGLIHDQELAVLEQKWAGQSNVVWGPKLKQASFRMNDAVVDLNTMLTLLKRKAKEGSDRKEALDNISHRMFPEGVGDITKDTYTGKLGKLINIEKVLEDTPWLDQTRMRTEITDFFDRFKVYKNEMRTRDWGMSYETIKKAQTVGHHNLCALVGLIVGLFPDAEKDRETREYLMTPIVDQNESMRRALKGRSKPKDPANDGSGNTNGGSANPSGAKGRDSKTDGKSGHKGQANNGKDANNKGDAKTGRAQGDNAKEHANQEAAAESTGKTMSGKATESKTEETSVAAKAEAKASDEVASTEAANAKSDESGTEKGKSDAA